MSMMLLLSDDAPNPRSLFAAGEQGFWYDPSDFSTLFQDAAGTTPVTALGQSVGLMLDKRLGLVRGSELVTNGDFSSTTAGWAASNSTIAVVSGQLEVTATGASGQFATSTSFNVVSGSYYEVTCLARAASGNVVAKSARIEVIITAGSVSQGKVDVPANGAEYTLRFIFKASASGAATINPAVASNGAWGGVGDKAYFDNISVRELPGNHAYQTTALSRPTVEALVNLLTKSEQFGDTVWTSAKSAGASVSSNTTVAPDGTTTADTVTFSGGADYIIQQLAGFTTNIGMAVELSYYSRVTQRIGVFGGASPAGTDVHSFADAGGGWYRHKTIRTFTVATTATLQILIASTVAGAGSYVIWGADLRASDQASYPYQRVNTATDYVDVGAARYELLDKVDAHFTAAAGGAGTTGFLLACGVVVPAAGTARTIFSDRGTNTGYMLGIDATNKVVFSGGTGASHTTLTSAGALTAGAKYILMAWHDGTMLNLSINNVAETPVAQGAVSAGTSSITIGKDNGSASGYWGDRIYTAVYRRNDSSSAAQRSGLYTYIVGKMGGL